MENCVDYVVVDHPYPQKNIPYHPDGPYYTLHIKTEKSNNKKKIEQKNVKKKRYKNEMKKKKKNRRTFSHQHLYIKYSIQFIKQFLFFEE